MLHDDSIYKTFNRNSIELLKSSLIVYQSQPEIIAFRGYPVEIHHVVTGDGYILELHRIPFGRRETRFENSTLQRKPVFLQHGMMATDHFWLLSSSNNSLGKSLLKIINRLITIVFLKRLSNKICSISSSSLHSGRSRIWWVI